VAVSSAGAANDAGTASRAGILNGNVAIIFAGGSGTRMDGASVPKQFQLAAGRPVIAHTLEHFQRHREIDAVYIACLAGWERRLDDLATAAGVSKLRRVVPGGRTAQHSIHNALEAAALDFDGDSLALVHDAVRPVITAALLSELIEVAGREGNAVTTGPADETYLLTADGRVADEVLPRARTLSAKAPQVFRLGDILDAHRRWREHDPDYTGLVDSATLMARCGHTIHLVAGERSNIKITYPDDLRHFLAWLETDAGSRPDGNRRAECRHSADEHADSQPTEGRHVGSHHGVGDHDGRP
jgi:2-C-methyl-D-erythritol 4-phosphate cytidylyltransferase